MTVELKFPALIGPEGVEVDVDVTRRGPSGQQGVSDQTRAASVFRHVTL